MVTTTAADSNNDPINANNLFTDSGYSDSSDFIAVRMETSDNIGPFYTIVINAKVANVQSIEITRKPRDGGSNIVEVLNILYVF